MPRRFLLSLVALGFLGSSSFTQPPVVPLPAVVPPVVPGMPMPPAVPPTVPEVGKPPEPGKPAEPAKPVEPPKPIKPPTEIAGKKIEAWIADFKSTDPTTRDNAVKVIPMFGYEAARKYAMKQVIALLDDPDPGIRINAILVIAAVGFDKVEDVKAATEKLSAGIQKTAPGSMIRLHAVRTLASLGPDAISCIGTLTQISNDPSWETRQAVAAALGRIGVAVYETPAPLPGQTTSLPAVLKREPSLTAMSKLNIVLIKDDSAAVRLEACQSLVVLGPPITEPSKYATVAQPFIQAIVGRLKNEKDPQVKVWLQLLHIMYDDRVLEPTIKTLMSDLSSPEPQVRVQALNALGILGAKAKSALQAMTSLLHQPDLDVTIAAVDNILMLGSEGRDAIPEFERLINETKNADLKTYVTNALKILKKFPPPLAAPPMMTNPMLPNGPKRPE